ncbi:MAG: TerC family protein [Legionella sp.]|nr:TerC family protein [Legionella sp.]
MDFIDIGSSLLALIILEIILGIDNLVFLSILTQKLPPEKRRKARQWGLTFAWVTRLLLLASAVYIVHLTHPIITLGPLALSFRDLFLISGGAFLIWKATDEIHQDFNDGPVGPVVKGKLGSQATFRAVVTQVALMDIIFSLDSVLTAIGLTNRFWIMATAITCAILVMIFASEVVSRFINTHPTIKMLALSFLILIGMVLIADGLAFHIPRGYIYFAMGFSLGVEALNLIKQAKKNKNKNK